MAKDLSTILKEYLRENPSAITTRKKLQTYLNEHQYPISYQSVKELVAGRQVPTFETCERILHTLGFQFTLQEIQEIVEYSKQTYLENKEPVTLQKGLRISPSAIMENCSVLQLEDMLHTRIEQLYGAEGNFNKYICDLIKNDLVPKQKGK